MIVRHPAAEDDLAEMLIRLDTTKLMGNYPVSP